MRRLLLLTALAVVVSTGSARAQPMYRMIGSGTVSCGTWTANRADKRNGLYWLNAQSWVLGFLSGAGYMGIHEGYDPLHGVDADGVAGWLDNYCRTHPLKDLADAAGVFVHEHPH